MSKINWKLDYTTLCGRNDAGTYTKHLRNWIRRLNIPEREMLDKKILPNMETVKTITKIERESLIQLITLCNI